MDIISGLAGIKAGIEAIKTSFDLTRDIKASTKSGPLQSAPSDALISARDEIQELKNVIAALKDKKQIGDELEHDEYVYWRNHPDGKRSGPYCPPCWTKDGVLLPLTHILGIFNAYTNPSRRYDCKFHGEFVVPTGETPHQRPRPVARGAYAPFG